MVKQSRAFMMLLEIVNTILKILNANGYNLWDKDDPNYYINEIKYCREEDKIMFNTEEE